MDRCLVKLAFAEGYKAGMLYTPPEQRERFNRFRGRQSGTLGLWEMISNPGWWKEYGLQENPIGTGGFLRPSQYKPPMPMPGTSHSIPSRPPQYDPHFNPAGTGLPKWQGWDLFGRQTANPLHRSIDRRYLLM